jgi:hypothetical protein
MTVLAVLLGLALAPNAVADSFVVDAAYDGSNPASVCEQPADASFFTSPEAALTTARYRSGPHTIRLCPGTYPDTQLDIDDADLVGLTLESTTGLAADVVLEAGHKHEVLEIRRADVTVRSLTVKGSKSAAVRVDAPRVVLSGLQVSGTRGDAIVLGDDADQSRLEQLSLADVGDDGIDVGWGADGVSIAQVEMAGLGDDGLKVQGGDAVVSEVTITGVKDRGIYVNGPRANLTNVSTTGGREGLRVSHRGAGTRLNGLTVSGVSSVGLYLDGPDLVLTGITLAGTGGDGVVLDSESDGSVLTSLSLSEIGDDGVQVQPGAEGVTLDGIHINGVGDDGMTLNASDATVSLAEIRGVTDRGVYVNGPRTNVSGLRTSGGNEGLRVSRHGDYSTLSDITVFGVSGEGVVIEDGAEGVTSQNILVLTDEEADYDGDGVANGQDAFPDDPAEWSDLDGDRIGDNADPDRDGDGISNDYELQVGTEPGNPASVPPDQDSDGIPDGLDDDRDGDGVANAEDTYPEDPTRSRLGAVAGLRALLADGAAELSWRDHEDPANTQGYNVYRNRFGEDTWTRRNAELVTGLAYTDADLQDSTDYRYRVAGVDLAGREGEPGVPAGLLAALPEGASVMVVDAAYDGTDPASACVQFEGARYFTEPDAALDAGRASPGPHTIRVCPETYRDVRLVFDAANLTGATLESATGTPSDVIFVADGYRPVVDVRRPDVVMRHITLAGNRGLGVRLDGARANLFGVTVMDTRGDGILLEKGADESALSYVTLNNIGDDAIQAERGADKLAISYIVIAGTGDDGIKVGGDDAWLSHLQLSGIGDRGIYLDGARPTVEAAVTTGGRSGLRVGRKGLQATITGLQVSDVSGVGLHLEGTQAAVEGFTARGARTAVDVDRRAAGSRLTDLLLENIGDVAIKVDAKETVLENVRITATGGDGVRFERHADHSRLSVATLEAIGDDGIQVHRHADHVSINDVAMEGLGDDGLKLEGDDSSAVRVTMTGVSDRGVYVNGARPVLTDISTEGGREGVVVSHRGKSSRLTGVSVNNVSRRGLVLEGERAVASDITVGNVEHGTGMELNSREAVLTGVGVTGTGDDGIRIGFRADYASLTQVTLAEIGDDAIEIHYGADHVSLSGVTVDGVGDDGITIYAKEVTVEDASIHGITDKGVYVSGASATLRNVRTRDGNEGVHVSRYGDGTVLEDLDIRYALVQSLYVDADALDVQVGEVNIITLAMDRDKDGILNELDTYPDDGTRYRLAPVTGLAAQIQGTGVRLTWDPHADPAATAGYRVYRWRVDEPDAVQLTDVPLDAVSYPDVTVDNATGYRYRVVGVDARGNLGEEAEWLEFFVAYNVTPVENFAVAREKADGRLNWDEAPGFRYRIFRGVADGEREPLTEMEVSTYLDEGALWNLSYRYQVATLADFVDVFTGLPVVVVGPRTAPADLPALPPLGLVIEDGVFDGTGAVQIFVRGGDSITLSGQYTEAVGPVDITASSGGPEFTATTENGNLRLVLPVQQALWTVRVSEQTVADRDVTATVRLLKDEQPPVVTLDGAPNRTVNADLIVISGQASDAETGIAEVYVSSDRLGGQLLAASLGEGGSFSAELPLQAGMNVLTAHARDLGDNLGQASVSVIRTVALAPGIVITSPPDGGTVTVESIDVTGAVYSGLAGEQLRVSLNDQQVFAEAGDETGRHGFTITGVKLTEGYNRVRVRVDSPAGSAEAQAIVQYEPVPPTPAEIPPPAIEITSPSLVTTFRDPSVVLAGSVSSSDGPVTLTIDGVTVPLVGPDAKGGSFQHLVDLAACVETQDVTLVAVDQGARSTARILSLRCDAAPPVVTLATPGLADAPAVNQVKETPFLLEGTVSDASLAGFTINGRRVGLLPAGGGYAFRASLALPLQQDYTALLEAWDLAGNRTSRELLFNADTPVVLEIITPREGTEVLTDAGGTAIRVVARASQVAEGDTVSVSVGGGAAEPMALDGRVATATLLTTLAGGEHPIRVELRDAVGELKASASTQVTLVDPAAVALAVTRSEPENAGAGVDPNGPIAIYFNQTIDPALLHVSVKETVHGKDYHTDDASGFTQIRDPEVVDVNRDMEPVSGALAYYPANRYVTFHPERRFAYGAEVYVEVSYHGDELSRFSYAIKPIPTLAAGVVVDQLSEAVGGLEVTLPDLGLGTTTNANGNYVFRSGDQGDLPGGRHRLVVNPGLANPLYGTLEAWANVEQGRVNSLSTLIVPLLNPAVPFVQIAGGEAQTLLAGGDLILDLSEATLLFPDGRPLGNVHVQFLTGSQVSFPPAGSAVPHWVYGVQPAGIQADGTLGVTIQMPSLYGGHEYVPPDGTLVVMLGFNTQAKVIEPVGVGEIQQLTVRGIGKLPMQSLDYIGYALVDEDVQPLLEQYRDGTMTLQALQTALQQ